MAKLTSINLPDADTKKARNNTIEIRVEGDVVARFNEARDQMDKAETVITELRPTLIEAGLDAVFNHNAEHKAEAKGLIASVNLTDEEGEIVQFSWSKKYLKFDPAQANEEFNRLRTLDGKKANINDYVGYEPVASFDAKVFVVDGKFSQKRYDAIMKAMTAVAAELGVDNPLSCGKVAKPKPEFHEKRWQMFDVESNLALQTVMPASTSLESIRPEAE
jgi:hypothetical protein